MRTCGPGYLDTIRREGRGADGRRGHEPVIAGECSRVGKGRQAAGISVFQERVQIGADNGERDRSAGRHGHIAKAGSKGFGGTLGGIGGYRAWSQNNLFKRADRCQTAGSISIGNLYHAVGLNRIQTAVGSYCDKIAARAAAIDWRCGRRRSAGIDLGNDAVVGIDEEERMRRVAGVRLKRDPVGGRDVRDPREHRRSGAVGAGKAENRVGAGIAGLGIYGAVRGKHKAIESRSTSRGEVLR